MNKEENGRKLYLFSDVRADSALEIIKAIDKFNAEDEDREKKEIDYVRKPIEIHINTYGGSIYDGLGICNAIQTSITPVHTYVRGYAMSMGFLIAAVGHERYAYENSTYMFHQASGFTGGFLEGIKDTHSEWVRLFDMYQDILNKVSDVDKDKMKEAIKTKSDWFITPEEALKYNLVDGIITVVSE